MRGLPIFFPKEQAVIEDVLADNGFVPDIDDETFGEAYERCPAVQRSVIKNGISFAYAVSQTGSEPVMDVRRFSRVERVMSGAPLDWALFAVDVRRFPVQALFSAVVQALVARVGTLVVHVTGPVTDALLFGLDFVSVHDVYTGDAAAILDTLKGAGKGVCVDLAGLGLDCPRRVAPDPAGYGVEMLLDASEYVEAYRAVTAETANGARIFLSYGGESGTAPVVMAPNLLGCWCWDVIDVQTFRRISLSFS